MVTDLNILLLNNVLAVKAQQIQTPKNILEVEIKPRLVYHNWMKNK